METKISRDQVINALKTVYDPEIPVDIWELGLIYDIAIDDENNIKIKMTLTTPNCPAAGSLPVQAEKSIAKIEGSKNVSVELVWEPSWNQQMMSEVAQLQLGYL